LHKDDFLKIFILKYAEAKATEERDLPSNDFLSVNTIN